MDGEGKDKERKRIRSLCITDPGSEGQFSSVESGGTPACLPGSPLPLGSLGACVGQGGMPASVAGRSR